MSRIKTALISVHDKSNLLNLLIILKKFKVNIISSGGTFKEIKRLGFKSNEISKLTNFPEILNGRVKTLHPKIHGGILSKRKNKIHNKNLKDNKISEIDLVIVNFYPFEKIISKTKNEKSIIENIDIGGPAMARAAAKNFNDVTVLTNINQYSDLIKNIKKNNGSTSLNFRKEMAKNAFSATAHYDVVVSNYFNNVLKDNFPNKKLISLNLIDRLRYGENPHQKASIYSSSNLNLKKLNGKQLSYNNYNDIYSALKISKSLPKNLGTVIIKHGNPCGVSINSNKLKSFELALKSDPISAYGGVISCNYKISKNIAKNISKIFLEAIVANGYENAALKILKTKKNLRIIDAKDLNLKYSENLLSNFNSLLIQTPDNKLFFPKDFKTVSKIKPSSKMLKNLIFAFNICRFVKSNAIVLTNGDSTIGIGSGQPSRVDSCNIAINKMKKFQKNNNEDILAASDAFFPFVDGIEKLVQSGVKAIIQPSGSIRDKEIIKYANDTNTVLVFSKTRHFNH
mgnify:CR=1 FL=1|tara:strand:- start:2688 stop:4223 length:1536 start_codon:yes stop_codon:yes gene_type:complete